MDPETIRALADVYGLEEVFHSASQKIIIFESLKQEDISTSLVITVWYDTKSAGVILPHPRRGRVQSFFFNLTIPKLREIFSRPNQNKDLNYIGSDWVTHQPTDVESEESALRRQLAALRFESDDITREVQELENRLEDLGGYERKKANLKNEIKFLEKQKSQTEAELHKALKRRMASLPNNDSLGQSTALNHRRRTPLMETSSSLTSGQDLKSRVSPRQTPVVLTHKYPDTNGEEEDNEEEEEEGDEDEEEDEEEEDEGDEGRGSGNVDVGVFASQKSLHLSRSASALERDSPARFRGNRCLFSFTNKEYQEEFGRSWSMKSVSCVALGRGYIIVYDDGGVAWWDVPAGLDSKFRDEDVVLPPVQYATMGPEGNYFVKYVDGKMEWVAKGSFQQQIKTGVSDRLLYVDKVALGPNGSWVILWTDGSVDYEGVSKDLAAVLKAIANGPGLRDVSLGPNGEWFTIMKDHSVQANNLPDSLHIALARIKREGGRVRSLDFGELSSWYVRYWDGK